MSMQDEMLEQENERLADNLSNKVSRLKNFAFDLQTEAEDSNIYLNGMVPTYILDGLRDFDPRLVQITDVYEAFLAVQHKDYTEQERASLLRYLLSSPNIPLDDLKLLPLMNGTWTSFNNRLTTVYIVEKENDQELLPKAMIDKFVNMSTLEEITKRKMIEFAKSGEGRLRMFDPSAFHLEISNYLKKLIETNENTCSKPETVDASWLKRVWNYIGKHFLNSLAKFEDLHIILCNDSSLCKLSPKAVVMDSQRMSKETRLVMEAIGVTLISNIPQWITSHPQFSSYVLCEDQLVTVIAKLSDKHDKNSLVQKVCQLENSLKIHLRRMLSTLPKNSITSDMRRCLETLPIFQVKSPDNVPENITFRSYNDCSIAIHNLKIHVSLPIPFILITDESSSDLVKLLSIEVYSEAKLFCNVILSHIDNYQPNEIELISEYVLQQLSNYRREGYDCRKLLQNIKFVETTSGRLVKPTDLVEPSEEFCMLFTPLDILPNSKFQERNLISLLKEVGLRKVDEISESEIVNSAVYIHKLNEKNDNAAQNYAKLLVQYLEKYSKKFNQTLRNKLKHYNWLPVLQTVPTEYPESIGWKGRSYITISPNEAISVEFADICGSSRVLVPKSAGLQFSLPTLNDVSKQLKACIRSYSEEDKPAFMKIIFKIYDFFQNNFKPDDIISALRTNNVLKWVWNGDGFSSPKNVVQNMPSNNLEPHLFKIPKEILRYQSFLEKCGVKPLCTIQEVLHRIKEFHENTSIVTEEDIQRDFQIANDLLILLSKKNSLIQKHIDILVPVNCSDQCLKLLPIKDCVYCDVDWLKKGIDVTDILDEMDSNSNVNLLHEGISNATAKALNVPSIMSRIFDAEELDISFGQKEILIDRLHSILEEYRDGLSIFKELVQNADDAGASEVRFLYDERENDDYKVCLFDDAMKCLQGRSLWCYNDKTFTEKDFQNIVKLGSGSKQSQTDKVGKFGLGFNSVYNLTDVPCFLSANNVVYFDPHTTYLGRSLPNKSNPGIKLDLTKPHVRKQVQRLPDQFHPFQGIFDCNIQGGEEFYDGTLFRFPLRTQEQAVKSKICNIHYSTTEIKKLFELLFESRFEFLLFTQNVRKVSVFHLSPNAKRPEDMHNLFTIEKSEDQVLKPLSLPECSNSQILRAANMIMMQSRSLTTSLNASSIMKIKCDTHMQAKNIISVSAKQEVCEKYFLVCSSIDAETNIPWVCKAKGLVPVGGIAVEIKKVKDHSWCPVQPCFSRLFCFLPIPQKSPFPVHINGYFSVSSNRTQICEHVKDDKDDFRPIWNKYLMQGAICESYMMLLYHMVDIADLNDETVKEIYKLWPKYYWHVEETSTLCDISISFYKRIIEEERFHLFPSYPQKLTCFRESAFLEESLRLSQVGNLALDILRRFQKRNVIDPPTSVIKSLLKTPQLNKSDHVYTALKFFKEIVIPNIHDLGVPQEQRDTILLFWMLQYDGNKEITMLLSSQSCVPVTPSGKKLCLPNQLIHPERSLRALFDNDDSKFPFWTDSSLEMVTESLGYPSKQNLERRILEKLTTLGMATDDMPWNEIIKSAKSVENSEYNEAIEKVTCLVSLFEHKLEKNDVPRDKIEELMLIKFLPVLQKPKSFPIQWNNNNSSKWISPYESFLSSSKYIVCCTKPVIDEESVFPKTKYKDWGNVKQLLGLKGKVVDVDIVFAQLAIVSRQCLNQMDDKCVTELRNCTDSICDYLQDCISSGKITETCSALQETSFLFPDGFTELVSPHKVFLHLSQNCEPYLYKLPKRFCQKYANLLHFLNVKSSPNTHELLKILENIKQECVDSSMTKKHLETICAIAKILYDEKVDDVQLTSSDDRPIYLPSESKVMVDTRFLCYPKFDWIDINEGNGPQKVQYCSHLIPYPHAAQLGVKTDRQAKIHQHKFGMAFGQREELTSRLKRLLTGYPCGTEVMKEMLQNADDAGAAEIHFILDPRKHKSDRVFEDGWKNLQGPSLLVYNDKPFTKKDLEGIQHLGEGSKSNDPIKTGQYGVGFNCVYHITDTPTFITNIEGLGKVLCAFDPHCKYVPDASDQSPGMMVDVDNLKDDFPDVFSCYDIDSNMLNLHCGTLFRLPFRTQEMATHSNIANNAFDEMTMKELFQEFSKEMCDALLFLNNIKTIKMSEIQDGNLITVSHVSAHLSEEDENNRQLFHTHIKSEMKKIYEENISPFASAIKEVSYNLTVKENHKLSKEESEWQIYQRFGVEHSDEINDILEKIKSKYEQGDIRLCPRGGIAFRENRAIKHRNSLFCFLPLPLTTNLPVHVNGHFALNYEQRQDLAKQGVGALWNQMLLYGVIAPTYVSLLCHLRENIPKQCKATTLKKYVQDFYRIFPDLNTDVNTENLNNALCFLQKGVYMWLGNKSCPILPMLKQNINNKDEFQQISWHPVTEVDGEKTYFNTLKGQLQHLGICKTLTNLPIPLPLGKIPSIEIHDILNDLLIDLGMVIVTVPSKILRNFQKSDVQVEEISAKEVADFLTSRSCKIPFLPCSVANTPFKRSSNIKYLSEYIVSTKKHIDSEISKENEKNAFPGDYCLEGLPILLTADENVHSLSANNDIFYSEFYDLIPKAPDHFLHPCLLDIFTYLRNRFKTFSINELANLLPLHLDEELYKGADKVVPFPKEMKTWFKKIWIFIQQSHREQSQINEIDIMDHLKPLELWSLVPCQRLQQNFLLPIGHASAVLDLENGDMHSVILRNALRKLNVFEADEKILSEKDIFGSSLMVSCYRNMLVGGINKPDSILLGIQRVVAAYGPLENITINDMQQEKLISYFAENFKVMESVPSGMDALKAIPMYKTVSGKNDSIPSTCIAYVIPKNIPLDDMDAFTSSSASYKFLYTSDNKSYNSLYEHVGCLALETAELYLTFVFVQWDMMTDEGQHSHIRFLKEIVQEENLKGKTELMGELAKIAFITDESGNKQQASYFFDYKNPVFRAMVEKKYFIPKSSPYSYSESWQYFLVQLGMKHTLSDSLFIEFALRLEKAASGTDSSSQELKDKSYTLIRYLFSDEHVVNSGILHQIKDICFIPHAEITKDKCELARPYKAFDGKLSFCCFNGSVFEHHVETSWTVCANIPDCFHPKYFLPSTITVNNKRKVWKGRETAINRILEELGIKGSVTAKMVADHTKNVCDGFYATLTSIEDIEKRKKYQDTFIPVLVKILMYLKTLDNSSKTLVKLFGNLKMIPVIYGTHQVTLVKPFQIVTRGLKKEESILPYLCTLPLDLGSCESIILQLGAVEEVTAECYAMVMKMIHNISGGDKLHPNEKQDALRAFNYFIGMLYPKKQYHGSELYLPGSDDCLHYSHELVHCDNAALKERISDQFDKVFLVECEIKSNLVIEFSTIFHTVLPPKLRPIPLSSIVVEEMEKENDTIDQCELGYKLLERLEEEDFLNGLCRIIYNASMESTEECELTKPDVEHKVQIIRETKIITLKNIRTYIRYDNKILSNSYKEKDISVSIEDGHLNVCINSQSATMEELFLLLAKKIPVLLDLPLMNPMLIKAILTLPVDKISSHLDENDIKSIGESGMKWNYLPRCGSHVPVDQHCLLVQNLEEINDGQYVAIEEYDPVIDGELSEPTYIYGKIVSKLQLQDNCLLNQKYMVDIGGGISKEIQILDIYKFQRNMEDDIQNDVIPHFASQDLNDIKKEITDQLEAAYLLPGKTKHKVTKRLLQNWDPDIFPQYKSKANEVYLHLKNEIQRFQNVSCSEPSENNTHYSDAAFKYLHERQQSHSKQLNQFKVRSQNSKSRKGFYIPKHTGKNPQPGLATRMLKQAKHDLTSIINDIQGPSGRFNEWICIKCYQATENALKGGQVSVDVNQKFDTSLLSLCWHDDDLKYLVRKMEAIIDNGKLTYPHFTYRGLLPHEHYSEADAKEAQEIAYQVLGIATKYTQCK